MAGALFERLVRPQIGRASWRIDTAGTWATAGLPASRNGVIVMENMGLDIQNHRSKQVDGALLSEFDLILTMEYGHKEALQIEFPDIADRVFMLSEMTGESHDVDDPIGGPVEDYEVTAKEIDRYLTKGFKKIMRLIQENPQ